MRFGSSIGLAGVATGASSGPPPGPAKARPSTCFRWDVRIGPGGRLGSRRRAANYARRGSLARVLLDQFAVTCLEAEERRSTARYMQPRPRTKAVPQRCLRVALGRKRTATEHNPVPDVQHVRGAPYARGGWAHQQASQIGDAPAPATEPQLHDRRDRETRRPRGAEA